MTRRKQQTSAARSIHRSIGAIAAVFIIFLVLTGLAINHSNGLGFDQKHMSAPAFLDWYGLEGPADIRSYRLGNNWLSLAGSHVYFNESAVSDLANSVGAVTTGPMLIVAGSNELLLLDQQGRLVERIPWQSSDPGVIESIGSLADDRVAVKSRGSIWVADKELLSWEQIDGSVSPPSWSTPASAPESLHQVISRHYRGEGLSLERLLLGLHSGRIFGPIGVFIYDLLALAIGMLAISGLVFWVQGRRNGKNKRNGQSNGQSNGLDNRPDK